jgi:hypothetical protein
MEMTNTATLLETTPLLPATGRKEHTCVVNIGLYHSGTTPLAEAFTKLELKAHRHFPSLPLPPHHLKKILQEPQAAVQEWYSSVGLKEILKLASQHAYISAMVGLPYSLFSNIPRWKKLSCKPKKQVST